MADAAEVLDALIGAVADVSKVVGGLDAEAEELLPETETVAEVDELLKVTVAVSTTVDT